MWPAYSGRIAELLDPGGSPRSDADRRAVARDANHPARPRLSVVSDALVNDVAVNDTANRTATTPMRTRPPARPRQGSPPGSTGHLPGSRFSMPPARIGGSDATARRHPADHPGRVETTGDRPASPAQTQNGGATGPCVDLVDAVQPDLSRSSSIRLFCPRRLTILFDQRMTADTPGNPRSEILSVTC